MENLENQITDTMTVSRNTYETMAESIAKMKLAFGNASLPEIFAVMVVVGYTAEKINDINSQLTELDTMCQSQVKENADQDEAQDIFNQKRDEITRKFNSHRGLLRIRFKGHIHERVVLQLDGEVPRSYANWTQMLNNFYSQIAQNSDLKAKVATVGIDEASITEQQQSIIELMIMKQSLRKETAEAQVATEARDRAFDALYPKYSEYIQYAKVLLPNNQLLEGLGVRVKRI